MRRHSIVLFCVTLASAAGPAQALDCARAVKPSDMNACAGQARAGADETLNAAFADLVDGPRMADRLDKLRAAERAWVAYRDAECAFEGSRLEGFALQPEAVESCAEALAKRRTADLRRALTCAEVGSGC